MDMTVREFIQGMLLLFCLMATGVILPIGLVIGSAAHDAGVVISTADPVFIFEETR
jgi:hypothetical protein